MTPRQLLDAQVDLYQRAQSLDWARMLMGPFDPNPDILTTMHKQLGYMARHARVYRVSEEMSRLIQHAASQLDDDDVWDPELAPSECGLVFFERSLPATAPDGIRQVHWATWGPMGGLPMPGLGGASDWAPMQVAWFFNDTNEPDEPTVRDLPNWTAFHRQFVGRWGPAALGHRHRGQALGPRDMASDKDGFVSTNDMRYLHAFFLLLTQRVTDVQPQQMPPAARKALQRKAPIPGKVSVVQLRRSESTRQPGESAVEWTRRWVVNGHWRWQAHGERRKQRRRIWITPYVKGPADKPLVVTDKVYDIKK